MARAVDVPFTKNSADHPRALHPAGLRALRHAVDHGNRDFFDAVDARARWRTTWRTYQTLLRCCGRQQRPRGSCEGRDSKIEALQNRS